MTLSEHEKNRKDLRRKLTKIFIRGKRDISSQINMLSVLEKIKALQQEYPFTCKLSVNQIGWDFAAHENEEKNWNLYIYYGQSPNYDTSSKGPNPYSNKLFYASGECNALSGTVMDGLVDIDKWKQHVIGRSLTYFDNASLWYPDGSRCVIEVEHFRKVATFVYCNPRHEFYRKYLPSQTRVDMRTWKPIEYEFRQGNYFCIPKEEVQQFMRLPRKMKEFEYSMRTGETV